MYNPLCLLVCTFTILIARGPHGIFSFSCLFGQILPFADFVATIALRLLRVLGRILGEEAAPGRCEQDSSMNVVSRLPG